MQRRRLANVGPEVAGIGLGCMECRGPMARRTRSRAWPRSSAPSTSASTCSTAARARSAPRGGPSDRVLADDAHPRGRDPAGLPRARHWCHGLRGPVARFARRALDCKHHFGRPRFSCARAAVRRREPAAQPASDGRPACAGRGASGHAGSAALHRGDDIVPLVGARTRERLAEAVAALEIRLDADTMAQLEAAVPAAAVAGARYDANGMRMLDSETRPGA